MAISLLTALIALGLLHFLPQLAQARDFGWFRRWVRQLSDTSGFGRVLLAILLPVIVCVVLMWLLDRLPIGDLLQMIFSLAVLLYCFGPREFESDLEAILHAPDGASREAAAQHLSDDGNSIAWNAPDLGVAIAYAALRRRFAVLLWFFLLGPAGALLYRLAQTLSRDESLSLDNGSRTAAGYLANTLDWLPAQFMVFTLAIVGHWDAVIGAWRQWHKQAAPTSWYKSGPEFLGAAAQADVLVDIEAGDGYAEERSDPLVELIRLRATLLRALLAWLSVVALIVVGGWLGD
ncbi:beta-lactamase induction protein [Rhodanobacter sp. L36]|uniref:beta-lactamase induction protein n=1 Tax=Rhodanobacter sp. L36 TaxID=1747221 RepID=UPI00131D2971|nr:beta-lactamase induction protein [Rhodanobacter sp. L36]